MLLAGRCAGSDAGLPTRRLRRRADSGILPPCSAGPRAVACCSSGSWRAARSPRTRSTNRCVSWPDTPTNAVRGRCLHRSTTCRKMAACSVWKGRLTCGRAVRSPTATRSPAVPARPRRRAVWHGAVAAAALSRTNASRMPIACSRRTKPTAAAVPSGCREVCWRPTPVFRRPLRRCRRSVTRVLRSPKPPVAPARPPPPWDAVSTGATATRSVSVSEACTGVVQ